MRGAVLCGLEESAIRERKCRRHYGLVLSYLFDKKRHGHIIRNGQYGKIFINQFLGNLWISHMTSWSFEKVMCHSVEAPVSLLANMLLGSGYY